MRGKKASESVSTRLPPPASCLHLSRKVGIGNAQLVKVRYLFPSPTPLHWGKYGSVGQDLGNMPYYLGEKPQQIRGADASQFYGWKSVGGSSGNATSYPAYRDRIVTPQKAQGLEASKKSLVSSLPGYRFR